MPKKFVRRPLTLELVAFAGDDDAVSHVLRLVAKDLVSWVGLYRIVEAVEGYAGGTSELVTRRWAPKKTLDLFKHTACSPGAIGDAARHGRERSAPPPNPMKLDDAKTLIREIVISWLEVRHGQSI